MKNVYDVCIIGGGSAGMGAAYALRGSEYKVLVVERQAVLGGTAVNAWVETWAESLNPPYLKPIFDELKAKGEADGNWDLSWVHQRFAKSGMSSQLVINAGALGAKYRADLKGSNITVWSEHELLRVSVREKGKIISVELWDVRMQKTVEVSARYFIDSSGDGVLCRNANPVEGEDYFYGEDGRDRFGESLAPHRPDKKIMNEPSLFFKIDLGKDDSSTLEKVKTVERKGSEVVKPEYINADGYYGGSWVNPLTGMGIQGMDLIPLEKKYVYYYELLKNKYQYEYWKYIKLNAQKYYEETGNEHYQWACGWEAGIRHYGHTGECAPALGIRESYRICCEYMLRQSDLTKRIRANDLKDYIACGSHGIDLHVYGNIDSNAVVSFNEKYLQPSGIPYTCLIPRKLTNVLVACRAYGASHIALAARRLNKDMAQLGWAAGHAVKMCLNKVCKDVREVDMNALQGPDYTDFRNSVAYLETLLK